MPKNRKSGLELTKVKEGMQRAADRNDKTTYDYAVKVSNHIKTEKVSFAKGRALSRHRK